MAFLARKTLYSHPTTAYEPQPPLRFFLILAPAGPAAALAATPPPAFGACAPALKVDCWPDVTDDAENMRSASRKRLIRRIAPLLWPVPPW